MACENDSTCYYYIDAQGAQQGPFHARQMRTWFDVGYLPLSTLCAATQHGEMPVTTDMLPISNMWSDPAADAFGGVANVVYSSTAIPTVSSAHHEVWADEDVPDCYPGKRNSQDSRRVTPYERVHGRSGTGCSSSSGSANGKGGKGGRGGKDGKGGRISLAFGGGGKGKGTGGDPGAPRSQAYKLRFEAAKAAGVGRPGGGPATGGGMATTRNPWDGRRVGT